MKKILEIPLKEPRKYISGNDLFDATEATFQGWVGDTAFVESFVMRKMAHSVCELRTADEPVNDAKVVGQVKARTTDGLHKGYIVETGAPVTASAPYPEQDMLQGYELGQDSIRQGDKSEFTPIEQIVALTKEMHYRTQAEISGKWIFIQLDLNQALPEGPSPFEIKIVNKLGTKLTISEIAYEDQLIGRIYFGVYNP